MGHNEMSTLGHDVYHEGLHVDVARRSQPTVHLQLADGSLPVSPEGEIDAQAVAGAADLVQEALEQDDTETQTTMLRKALVALDREAEQ